MRIKPEEVAKVARLSRLDLSEDKLNMFAGQIGDILLYMEKLNELDTTGVEPLYSPVAHTTVLRADEVRKDYAREEILAGAPETDGQYFIVPKIV